MSTLMECSLFEELTLVSLKRAFFFFSSGWEYCPNQLWCYDQMRSGILWEQWGQEDVWEVFACKLML